MAIAVVTGAGQGLGRATAERLSADGFSVVVLDIDGDKAKATAELVGGRHLVCDVSDPDSVRAAADQIERVDALVNNAGIWRFGPLLEASPRDVLDVLNVNLLGTLHCCRAFAAKFDQGGAIVNLSSAAARMAAPGLQIYSVSKEAVETLTRQLSSELGPLGIRVNAVAPGLIVTEGTSSNYEGDRASARMAAIPLHRLGRPQDIANVVAFLVSERSSYVSGQLICVDGGLTASRPSI
jgi:3-oxoacyl-[acyl-carrier protein] reductase